MKYIEIEIKLKPEDVESLLNELSIVGINDAVINNPVEIAEIVSNLGDTEWYDAEQVADDFVGSAALGKSQNYGDAKMSDAKGNDVPTLATITIYCSDDEDGRERVELVKHIVATSARTSQSDEASNNGIFSDIDKDFDDDLQSGTVPILKTRVRDDSEWKDAWKEYYHTARVSERFIVKPTWEAMPSDLAQVGVAPGLNEFACNDLLVIEIDPGMAFGTGTHETTSLSLRMMEKYVKTGDKVLDVGTGSGILAIAAAKLGAVDVLGIDIDEDAVRVANENINSNLQVGTVPNAKAVVGDLTEGIDYKADVVVANLLADLVMKLTSSVAEHMNEGAVYITSGILIDKQEQVVACLVEKNFEIIEILEDGEWCAVAATKK